MAVHMFSGQNNFRARITMPRLLIIFSGPQDIWDNPRPAVWGILESYWFVLDCGNSLGFYFLPSQNRRVCLLGSPTHRKQLKSFCNKGKNCFRGIRRGSPQIVALIKSGT